MYEHHVFHVWGEGAFFSTSRYLFCSLSPNVIRGGYKVSEDNGMYLGKIEVLVMSNGEILCFGRSIGFVDEVIGKKLLGDYIDYRKDKE